MLSEKDRHFRNKSVQINHDNILKTKEAKNDVNVTGRTLSTPTFSLVYQVYVESMLMQVCPEYL